MRELKPLPNKINNIEVVEDMGMNNQVPKKRLAKFKCECGNIFIAKVNAISSGDKRSCGCLKTKPSRFTHLLSKHPLYRKWSGMITRVTNKKEKRWDRYGGRGISICNEWKNDFMSFYKWAINNGWSEGLTIDRIDNNGNYEPSNCQWITMKENNIKDKLKFNPSKEQEKTICDTYVNCHITVTEIARQYHTHKQRISSILRKNKIEIIHRRMKK